MSPLPVPGTGVMRFDGKSPMSPDAPCATHCYARRPAECVTRLGIPPAAVQQVLAMNVAGRAGFHAMAYARATARLRARSARECQEKKRAWIAISVDAMLVAGGSRTSDARAARLAHLTCVRPNSDEWKAAEGRAAKQDEWDG